MSQSGLGPVLARQAAPTVEAKIVRVKELQPAEFVRWDDFVTGCDDATFFHCVGWKTVIERVFGHRAPIL